MEPWIAGQPSASCRALVKRICLFSEEARAYRTNGHCLMAAGLESAPFRAWMQNSSRHCAPAALPIFSDTTFGSYLSSVAVTNLGRAELALKIFLNASALGLTAGLHDTFYHANVTGADFVLLSSADLQRLGADIEPALEWRYEQAAGCACVDEPWVAETYGFWPSLPMRCEEQIRIICHIGSMSAGGAPCVLEPLLLPFPLGPPMSRISFALSNEDHGRLRRMIGWLSDTAASGLCAAPSFLAHRAPLLNAIATDWQAPFWELSTDEVAGFLFFCWGCGVQCSAAVQCSSAVKCSKLQQCSAVQQCSAARCSAVQCSAVQYSSAVQCSAAVQCTEGIIYFCWRSASEQLLTYSMHLPSMPERIC